MQANHPPRLTLAFVNPQPLPQEASANVRPEPYAVQNPLEDSHYADRDEQIDDLKDVAVKLALLLETAVDTGLSECGKDDARKLIARLNYHPDEALPT